MRSSPCFIALVASMVALPVAAQEPPTEAEPWKSLLDVPLDKPFGLCFDGTLLWVVSRVEGLLLGLEPSTGKEKQRIPSPGPRPVGLAFDGKLLWVSDPLENKLYGVDTKAGLVTREVPSPTGALGLAYDGSHLWVADGKLLHQVTTEDGTTIKSWNAPSWGGEGRATEQLGLAYDGQALWVSDRKTDLVYRVDPETGAVLDAIVAPGPMVAGIAFDSRGRMLAIEVGSRSLFALDVRGWPAVVRSSGVEREVVLRRSIANRGPGIVRRAQVVIALPSSNEGQALMGEPVFSLPPKEIVQDEWGQKVARFEGSDLQAGQTFEVEMKVRARVFDVHRHIDPAKVGSLASIPKSVRRNYLSDSTKFALKHPSIRRHLKAALQGENRPYWMARRIARYIQDHMTYALEGGWNIAPTVIDRGTGSCSEYTFVFIAMCRLAGIPARYVGAIVVRGDDASTDEIFHRWPEIYLPGYGFVPFDVQAGDKPEPEKQGEVLGNLPGKFLVTTTGGGGSRLLGWDYNSSATWTCEGRCSIQDEHLADWYLPGAQGARSTTLRSGAQKGSLNSPHVKIVWPARSCYGDRPRQL
ncbi:MAG: transglutaminase [Myxococcota bacterium]|jgi:hypothetical protein|nr:transglutaminase [Myxococcota bacterium]